MSVCIINIYIYINKNQVLMKRLNVRRIVTVYVNLFSLKRKCIQINNYSWKFVQFSNLHIHLNLF